MIKIVPLTMEHLESIDMREHEKSLDINNEAILEHMVYGEAALLDGEVLCYWGAFKDGGIWQVPSKKVGGVSFKYARQAIKVMRRILKMFPKAYTLSLDDALHDRWMRFIGFKPVGHIVILDNGMQYRRYEVA